MPLRNVGDVGKRKSRGGWMDGRDEERGSYVARNMTIFLNIIRAILSKASILYVNPYDHIQE